MNRGDPNTEFLTPNCSKRARARIVSFGLWKFNKKSYDLVKHHDLDFVAVVMTFIRFYFNLVGSGA